MNSATIPSATPVRSSLPARALAVLAGLPGAIVSALSRRSAQRPVDRVAAEHEALCGLSEHVLRDIGASPWLVAEAAECARSSLDAAYERRLY